MYRPIGILGAGLACALIALRADLRRRRLSWKQGSGWDTLSALDVACPAAISGVIGSLFAEMAPIALATHAILLNSPLTWGIATSLLAVIFLWNEGRRQVQFQRPPGLVFGETLLLAGVYMGIESLIFSATDWPGVPRGTGVHIACILAAVAGGAVIGVVVPPFAKGYEGHRILHRSTKEGESIQAEYVPASPECPHPERWKMIDTQTTEVEVIDFLKSLVIALKPNLIVETGTFLGYSTIKMAEGLQANGFGKIISIEYDPVIYARAKDRIDASGLGRWIECRNESSLEARIDGTIDLLFSDSHRTIRGREIRRLLPQVDPNGLVIVHDTSSHFQVVHESVMQLERDGLLHTVWLPTPRGLVIAQKPQGHKKSAIVA